MNYYRRYSGDYLRDTARLNLTEHGAYSLLMDYYYTDERPLPADHQELYLMLRAMRPEDRKAVDKVLSVFFTLAEDGYHQKRIDHEIAVSKKARANGSKGGRPLTESITGHITESLTGSVTGLITETGGGSVHPPTTNLQPPAVNHQPPKKTGGQLRSRGSRLLPDWKPSEILEAWAVKERPDLDVPAVVAKFVDYWRGVPGSKGVKLDWEATFRNFIRTEKPGSKPKEIDHAAFAKRIEEEDRQRAGS